MKKLTKYQLSKISNNLDFFLNIATKNDIKNGLNWYKDANNICKNIAQKYQTSELIAANVISCLSPRNKWERNIKDAYNTFEAIKNNKDINSYNVCTFNNNKLKAYFCAKNNTIVINKSSLKTYNFVQNCLLDDSSLTIDIWHLRACFKDNLNINNTAIGKIAYEQIKRLTINKADKLSLKGYEFQAIIWLSAQNYFNNLNK